MVVLFKGNCYEIQKVEGTFNNMIYTAKSVQDFLDYLLPQANHWVAARLGDLAYRGQASSQWPPRSQSI